MVLEKWNFDSLFMSFERWPPRRNSSNKGFAVGRRKKAKLRISLVWLIRCRHSSRNSGENLAGHIFSVGDVYLQAKASN